jgi:endonuclease-3
MKKKERASFILDYLERIYPETPIPLNHKNNFELLVAVLLSAQCTDERVNKVTPALFLKGNDPISMAKMSIDEIHYCIRSCGLAPKKSKAIFDKNKIKISLYRPFFKQFLYF